MPQEPVPVSDQDRIAALASVPVDRGLPAPAAPVPPDVSLYVEGWKAGFAAGYAEGKGTGYADAKLRSRLAVEASCERLGLPPVQVNELMRALDATAGTVR